jgi:hypothetical protein
LRWGGEAKRSAVGVRLLATNWFIHQHKALWLTIL